MWCVEWELEVILGSRTEGEPTVRHCCMIFSVLTQFMAAVLILTLSEVLCSVLKESCLSVYDRV